MGDRPVASRIFALTQSLPLCSIVGRGRQPLLKRTDDGILPGIELPVGSDQPEPCHAFGYEDNGREDQQPRGRVRVVRPEESDGGEYGGVER